MVGRITKHQRFVRRVARRYYPIRWEWQGHGLFLLFEY